MRSSVRTFGRKARVLPQLLPEPQEAPKRRWQWRTQQVLKLIPFSRGAENALFFSFFSGFFAIVYFPAPLKRSLYFSPSKGVHAFKEPLSRFRASAAGKEPGDCPRLLRNG